MCGCSEGGAGAGGSRDDRGLRHRPQHPGAEASPRLGAQSSRRGAADLPGR